MEMRVSAGDGDDGDGCVGGVGFGGWGGDIYIFFFLVLRLESW